MKPVLLPGRSATCIGNLGMSVACQELVVLGFLNWKQHGHDMLHVSRGYYSKVWHSTHFFNTLKLLQISQYEFNIGNITI